MRAFARHDQRTLARCSCCALLLALSACQDRTIDLVPFPPGSAGVDLACGLQTAPCVKDKDCCPSAPIPVHCLEDAPGVHTRHCASDPPKDCHADTELCEHAKDCCGGYCLPEATGTLNCSSLCRAFGQACTGPADCCAGLGCPPSEDGQQCTTMP